MMMETAAICLAMNIFMEARGEPVMGQYAVALVTMNRAKWDKRKVCQVVRKHKQFSWTTRLLKGAKVMKAGIPHDADAWDKAWKIANMTLAGRMPDFTRGSTFYHATRVSPLWASSMERTRKVGAHLFYRLAHKSAVTNNEGA
jgi:N-acetylmuramoyl-L-alanine amidase